VPRERLTSPQIVRRLLVSEGIRPRRAFGQNFLVDANILRIITGAAGLRSSDTVIEVGPGLGALTQALVEQVRHVYAIEFDPTMVKILEKEFTGADRLVLVHADALAFDLASFREGSPPERVKMVSNLPYQIAATLVVKWLIKYPWLSEYTVMVQREVADRIAANPGSKEYSAASVKIQYRAKVERVAGVSRNSFYPRPGVDSAVLHLERLADGGERDIPLACDEPFFDQVVTSAFSQRRKKLANSVAAGVPGVDRDSVVDALHAMGRHEAVRAEELSQVEFTELSNYLLALTRASEGVLPTKQRT